LADSNIFRVTPVAVAEGAVAFAEQLAPESQLDARQASILALAHSFMRHGNPLSNPLRLHCFLFSDNKCARRRFHFKKKAAVAILTTAAAARIAETLTAAELRRDIAHKLQL
jgi:hypothetical protein